jgi:hypothetical protein
LQPQPRRHAETSGEIDAGLPHRLPVERLIAQDGRRDACIEFMGHEKTFRNMGGRS